MPNTSKQLTTSKQAQPTTLMILKQCSDKKKAFNEIAKIEQSLTVTESLKNGELLASQGSKIDIIVEIIKIIEFYLEVTGKKLENYQIRILAGDLYKKFIHDTLEDLILMFQMIRTGDLGKPHYTDNFHEKIMSYVPLFFDFKSAERERLIKVRKRKQNPPEPQGMSDEAYEKFTELQNRISTPVKKSKEVFSVKSILSSVDNYLDSLPESCKKLSDSDLSYEIKRTEYNNKTAWEILLQEKERRKNDKSNSKRKDNKDED
ncbi:hypothetical protein NZ698_00420 [Chryseobacterium sp. PBS4-4]|uniref:Uncharacterized protein n=1 Tax=Chryseobacterium edaphi TaxID=2976532 RepID=A0ABT2W148_9FLAO|nr:hypothetical protein [Chryseobacterium edaphi]MCU7615644.1 hypothetical protein [Chryseobacterium edaphi]